MNLINCERLKFLKTELDSLAVSCGANTDACQSEAVCQSSFEMANQLLALTKTNHAGMKHSVNWYCSLFLTTVKLSAKVQFSSSAELLNLKHASHICIGWLCFSGC